MKLLVLEYKICNRRLPQIRCSKKSGVINKIYEIAPMDRLELHDNGVDDATNPRFAA